MPATRCTTTTPPSPHGSGVRRALRPMALASARRAGQRQQCSVRGRRPVLSAEALKDFDGAAHAPTVAQAPTRSTKRVSLCFPRTCLTRRQTSASSSADRPQHTSTKRQRTFPDLSCGPIRPYRYVEPIPEMQGEGESAGAGWYRHVVSPTRPRSCTGSGASALQRRFAPPWSPSGPIGSRTPSGWTAWPMLRS